MRAGQSPTPTHSKAPLYRADRGVRPYKTLGDKMYAHRAAGCGHPALRRTRDAIRRGDVGIAPYAGPRRTDCHTSDVGHWFAMTAFLPGVHTSGAGRCGHPALRAFCAYRAGRCGHRSLRMGRNLARPGRWARIGGVKFSWTGKNRTGRIAFARRFCYNKICMCRNMSFGAIATLKRDII